MLVEDVRPGWIVLYDRDCGFCRWCLAKLLRWDRRRALRPVAFQEPEGAGLLARVDQNDPTASWHLVSPEGRIHSGGEAFAPLLAQLPGGAVLSRVAARLPKLADRAYRAVADRRGFFGRLVSRSAVDRASRRIDERAGT
jgi:predicted DCC family thiol-disulfide oxidoreductase YuxK